MMIPWTFEEKDVDAEGNGFIAGFNGTATHLITAYSYMLQLE